MCTGPSYAQTGTDKARYCEIRTLGLQRISQIFPERKSCKNEEIKWFKTPTTPPEKNQGKWKTPSNSQIQQYLHNFNSKQRLKWLFHSQRDYHVHIIYKTGSEIYLPRTICHDLRECATAEWSGKWHETSIIPAQVLRHRNSPRWWRRDTKMLALYGEEQYKSQGSKKALLKVKPAEWI